MRNMSDDHTHVQEFFTARAAAWDSRFPDDGPAFAAAVAELGLREGDRVLDAGCGTGRALPPLRAAVGPSGVVLGADLTPAMLEAAVRAGRGADGQLLLADVAALPLRPESRLRRAKGPTRTSTVCSASCSRAPGATNKNFLVAS